MSEKYNPAFPCHDNDTGVFWTGLTKFELVATLIMQGYCSNPDFATKSNSELTELAISQAQSLLKRLSQ